MTMNTSERAWLTVACFASLAVVGGAWTDVRHLLVVIVITVLTIIGAVVGGAVIYDWIIRGDEDLEGRRSNRFR